MTDPFRADAPPHEDPRLQRDALRDRVWEFAGPLGPFGDPEERDAQQNQWADSLPVDAIEPLLAVLVEPRPPRHGPFTCHFPLVCGDILARVGRRAPERLLAATSQLLGPGPGREEILDLLGTFADPRGLELLAPFARAPQRLAWNEQIALADALGQIGGPVADALLVEMQALVTSPTVLEEIDIGREWASRPHE